MAESENRDIDLNSYRFDGANKNSIDRDALASWLEQTLEVYVTMRSLEQGFFGFNSRVEMWEEFERCYAARAKAVRNKKYEYAGYSNIVTGEFHKTIDVMVDKWMQALFSGARLFGVKPTRYSAYEDAHLAELLGQYSIDRVESFQTEMRKVVFATVIYGTCFVYIPWVVKDQYRGVEILHAEKNADGSPGQPSEIPELFEIYDEIKFTDFENINPKRVFVNPDVSKLQNQEAVYIKQTVSWSELLEMEADGIIDAGMADHMLNTYTDSDNDGVDDKAAGKDTGADNRLRSFDIYLVYKRMQFEDGTKGLYEIIYTDSPQKILGMRPYLHERIPLLKSNFIPVDGCLYGQSLGEIIYSMFLALCGRLNQVFDAESMQILGGGFYDSDLMSESDLKKAAPGKYIGIPGLSAYMGNNNNSILSYQKLSGAHPASVGLDIMAIINRSIQDGSGITNTMSGMPTNTQADKTFRGMELLAEEADVRIGASLGLFEEDIPKTYVEDAYDNYSRLLDPQIDLPRMFDADQLSYVDAQGQRVPVRFGENLRQVEFVFESAKRLVEKDIKLGKIQRFVQIVDMIWQRLQAFSMLGIDPSYFIQEIAKQLDFADVDTFMPANQSPMARLQQALAQMQQLQTTTQAQQVFINLVRQKLGGMKDQTGLIAMEQAQREVETQIQKQGVKNNA
jgi:hypothetical protein